MQSYTVQNAGDWAKVGEHLAQIDSTNRELQRRLAQRVLPEGYSLRADFQHDGRGRMGRTWEAAPGANLAVSFLLRNPGLSGSSIFLLSQNVALAVREVIERFLATATRTIAVKWPNDIYIDDRKVAGILIETSFQANRLSHAVIGIGINVNQLQFDQAPHATSLALETGENVDLQQVFEHLATSLQQRHYRLRRLCRTTGDLYALTSEYHTHLRGLGHTATYQLLRTQELMSAKLVGVNNDGTLRLEHRGEERAFAMDEIKVLADDFLKR